MRVIFNRWSTVGIKTGVGHCAQQLLSLVNQSAFGYTLYSYTVTAASASTVLAFFGRENPAFYDLDNVTVQGPPGLAATNWIGGQNGNQWSTAANWSAGLPT